MTPNPQWLDAAFWRDVVEVAHLEVSGRGWERRWAQLSNLREGRRLGIIT